ncbi:DNA helicase RecQ [Geobacter sp. SVR]|uniref:DNA helicase RecQ n=1 Tax=Geobacter sp. SVR TaxID=2495594 RepID=UPI00143EFD88|nr:DNA helicase RecQ [Geobacter sp. SVR]BCS54670.1 ATP-dependent DNA helicase RecQ [Geobacter sp. SVR]GCF87610.1 ATP-dependent DNA helicase RecQ [Geobacter sp. SVR]
MVTIKETLRTVFGFHEFRAPQQEVIEQVLAGEDVFLVMPTGGGKSLCYQIPALHREGLAIVVSPLISLMKDQVDALIANGVRAACYNSSLSAQEARRVSQQLDAGELDLLYVAPERLMLPEFLERLGTLKLALFAIDEAHCISQWGHDFRPDYVQIGRLRSLFPDVPIVAMTATADPETRNDITRQLDIQQARVHVAGFDRPNISYTVMPKHKPMAQLEAFLKGRRDEAGIVYALSRNRVEQVAERLCAAGFAAAAYHAGLSDTERHRVQDAFRRDDLRIVVATVAFGMGIDKPNVRFVVHYDMPKSVESYYQETGRAGRDGLPSEALMLFGMGDVMTARALINNSDNAERIRIELQKLNAMVAYSEALTCRRRALLAYFGESRTHDCGNCDICVEPPQRFDATEAARKVLSCVYRVGERFGARHVIDVLRGSQGQRILDLGHNRLSTYGIGADLSAAEWDNIIRQLIHLGYLVQDFTRFGALTLSPLARPLLKGEAHVTLGLPRNAEVAKEKPARRGATVGEADRALFDELRALRKQIADAASVPPFVVFSDATLVAMATARPRDERELRLIGGVGDYKLRTYGAPFLAVIGRHDRVIDRLAEQADGPPEDMYA